jgi:hypothetical protein
VITWNCLVCIGPAVSPVIVRDRRGYGSWIVSTECASCASIVYHCKFGDWIFENDFYPRAWLANASEYQLRNLACPKPTFERRKIMGSTEMEARLGAMRETIKTAERQVDTWDPKPGEDMVGVLVGKRTIVIEKKDRESDIYDFDIGDRTIGVWDCADIKRQFTSHKVRFGDIVGLKFLGKELGGTMKLFVVTVDHVDPGAELVCPPPEPKKKNGSGKVAVDDNVPF